MSNVTETAMSNADSIADQAYTSWELKQFSEAAELFLEASLIESAEASHRSKWASPDSSVLHRLRAGWCFFEDGRIERALKLVAEGMEFDWKAARFWADRRDAEKCHICFILHFANLGDQSNYASHVERAIKDGDRLCIQFPWSTPVKKKSITAALVMNDLENLSKWVERVDAEAQQRDPELGLLCKQAARALADYTGG